MTEINNELISEIIFTNEKAFNNLDINKAKILSCICKTASLNKNIKLSFDRFKAREYFDKIFDVITHHIMYKKKEKYIEREELNIIYGNEYSITSQLDDIIDDLRELSSKQQASIIWITDEINSKLKGERNAD